MTASSKGKTVPFKKAPLLEAIFELRWELPLVPNTQVRRDPAYPLLYGRLYDRFKKDYTVVEDLPSIQVHPDASPYTARHRMRKAADAWPIVQVGPGIITLHEGPDYSWERFREEIIRIFEAFTDFYPASTFPLNILKTELRFVNGVEIRPGDDYFEFFAKELGTKIELDPVLFASTRVQPKPEAASLSAGFIIEQPVGNAMLAMGTGAMENKPAIIQQMLFQSLVENAPQDLGSLDPWLDGMHKIAKSWFSTLFLSEPALKHS